MPLTNVNSDSWGVMMQVNGSFPAAILCNSTAILRRPSSLSLINI